MSVTPAAELARLRVTYKRWRIERTTTGEDQPPLYIATGRHDPARKLTAATISELDQILNRADWQADRQ